ncbi:hypothetical protein HJFPF1_03942 [Paramyrothecium foliicola]|nr:hypothetical protein HJFPF1_03942 [Paramyrothecium foliicola]
MGDPLSVTSALIAIVTASIQSSKALYRTVQSFKNHQSTVERLTRELVALTAVLQSLEYHVASDEQPFLPLKFPLRQCCQACREFKLLLDKNTQRSGPYRTSFRDWGKLQYMRSDVDEFANMLSGYKSTINIALADATLRSSKVTLEVLNEYKDLIHDTKDDLERHLVHINSKLESLTSQQRRPSASTQRDVQRAQGDKSSTKECIEYCKHLLEQLNTLQFRVVGVEPTPEQGPQTGLISPTSVTYADALTLSTFKDCSNKITKTLNDLEAYMLQEAREQTSSIQLDPSSDRERLLGEANSLQQRLEFCDGASNRASEARVHVLEDIRVGAYSRQMCVSTLGDLFNVKGATAGDGSVQIFGSTTESGLSELLKSLNQSVTSKNRDTTENFMHASSSAQGKAPAK